MYWRAEHARAEEACKRGQVLVVTPSGADNTFLGFAVHEGGVLHYAFVKSPFRRQGLCALLLASLPSSFSYTHMTDDWRRVVRSRPSTVFNPYLAGGPVG